MIGVYCEHPCVETATTVSGRTVLKDDVDGALLCDARATRRVTNDTHQTTITITCYSAISDDAVKDALDHLLHHLREDEEPPD